MSVIHFGGDSVSMKAPICGRTPSWSRMSNMWSSVTCKWCLRKRDEIERTQRAPANGEASR